MWIVGVECHHVLRRGVRTRVLGCRGEVSTRVRVAPGGGGGGVGWNALGLWAVWLR